MMPRVCLIAAASLNDVIGDSGGIPWKLPGDLKNFKKITMGKPIIMGRKTWDSIGGKPLPGRLNIVISREPSLYLEGAEVYRCLHAALSRAEWWADNRGLSEVMVIGGSQIYEQAMPFAHRIYLTRVNQEFHGDSTFPKIDPTLWTPSTSPVMGESSESPSYTFQVWDLKRPPI